MSAILRPLALAAVAVVLAPVAAANVVVPDADEIHIGDFSIVSSTTTADGLVLELSAELQNLDGGRFESINASLAGGRASGLPFRVQAEGALDYEDIEPWGVTSPAHDSRTITLTIPRSQVRQTLNTLARDGLIWELIGVETTVYQDGVHVMDQQTNELYFPYDGLAGFDAWTDLLLEVEVGDIIVFAESCPDTGTLEYHLCPPKDPWEVLDMGEDDIGIWIEYEPRGDLGLEDLIESGTLSSTFLAVGSGMHQSVYDQGNKWESCSYDEETEDYACEFSGLYLAEDGMVMGDATTLDGGMNMRGITTALEVKMREGGVSKTSFEFLFDYDSAMAVRATDPDVVTNFEQPLFDHSIPIAATSIGGVPIEVEIDISLTLGAESDFSTGSSFGLFQRGAVGVTFAEDIDEGFTATPTIEVDPFLSSPPTLATNASGSFRSWLALEAQVEINGGLLGGPSARLVGFTEFTVDPGLDPWWEVSAGGEVEGTLELELLGIEIAAHTFGLQTETSRTVAADDAPYSGVTGLASGEEVRWAENFHYGGTWGDYPVGVDTADNGDLVFATWNPAVVARTDATGDLLWDTYLSGPSLGGVATYDGGILAFGENGRSFWVGELDDDGNEVQQHQYAFDHLFDLLDVHPVDDGPTPSFIASGTILYDDSWFHAWLAYFTYDPSATDDPVTWHWARIYDSQTTYGPYPDSFHDVYWDDGDIYIAGVTTAGELEGHISYNALVAKLDSDGQPIWAKATRDGADYLYTLTMADDDTLVAAGSISQIVTQVHWFHSAWLGMFDATTGDYEGSTTLSEDLWWASYPSTAGYPSYTTPGASIYDAIYALEPLNDGGFAAIGVSGLSKEVGWVMSLDSGLNVRWLSTFEGDSGGEVVPTYFTDTGHGLAVMANTTAPYAAGYGSGRDAMLLSVPYDGILDFHEDTLLDSRYTKPDMVEAPYEGEQQDLTYLLTDLVPTHGAGTASFAGSVLSTWTLDPWDSTHASMAPSTRQSFGNQQKRSPTRTSPSKAMPSRSP
jgi:hypothetical protein